MFRDTKMEDPFKHKLYISTTDFMLIHCSLFVSTFFQLIQTLCFLVLFPLALILL